MGRAERAGQGVDTGLFHEIQRLLQIVQCLPVVQMNTDRNGCLFREIHHQRPDQFQRDPLLMALGKLKNHRNLQFLRRRHIGLQTLQIGSVKSPHRNLSVFRNL